MNKDWNVKAGTLIFLILTTMGVSVWQMYLNNITFGEWWACAAPLLSAAVGWVTGNTKTPSAP